MERPPYDTPGIRRSPGSDDAASLAALRADFPHFRIWHEVIGGRSRYVARRLNPGSGLHTVVTTDLAEMRSVLRDAHRQCNA